MHTSDLSPRAQKFFKMIEFDENERLIEEIRKHPFGLFLIYASGLFVSVVLFLVFIIGGLFINDGLADADVQLGNVQSLSVLLGGILTILSLLVTGIAGYLYQGNIIIITSQKVAQILNRSIVSRTISQLSIGDVQDVSIKQDGLFARLFNYGTLIIETAGEQNNYIFTFTPHPYDTGKAIVGARQDDLEKHGN